MMIVYTIMGYFINKDTAEVYTSSVKQIVVEQLRVSWNRSHDDCGECVLH